MFCLGFSLLATVGVGLGQSPALAAAVVMVFAGAVAQSCLRWAMRQEMRINER